MPCGYPPTKCHTRTFRSTLTYNDLCMLATIVLKRLEPKRPLFPRPQEWQQCCSSKSVSKACWSHCDILL